MPAKRFVLRGRVQQEAALVFIRALNVDIARPWTVSISHAEPERSLEQNGLFWRLVNLAAREAGYTPSTVHDVLCAAFWGVADVTIGRVRMVRPAQTLTTGPDGERRKLSKPDMAAFLTFTLAYLAEHFGIADTSPCP